MNAIQLNKRSHESLLLLQTTLAGQGADTIIRDSITLFMLQGGKIKAKLHQFYSDADGAKIDRIHVENPICMDHLEQALGRKPSHGDVSIVARAALNSRVGIARGNNNFVSARLNRSDVQHIAEVFGDGMTISTVLEHALRLFLLNPPVDAARMANAWKSDKDCKEKKASYHVRVNNFATQRLQILKNDFRVSKASSTSAAVYYFLDLFECPPEMPFIALKGVNGSVFLCDPTHPYCDAKFDHMSGLLHRDGTLLQLATAQDVALLASKFNLSKNKTIPVRVRGDKIYNFPLC